LAKRSSNETKNVYHKSGRKLTVVNPLPGCVKINQITLSCFTELESTRKINNFTS